ncbi:MAG TPA: hypothetical protein VFF64_04820, partial [Candidatus Eremiobacteraceae bacterium]|nr:hypothetical protein [Candidatus Eremiobacteraceae bacterium]
ETKLTTLREELLPKIRQPALEQSVAKLQVELSSVDARVATELQSAAERHSAQIQQSETRFGEALERLRQQLAAESKTPALEQSVAKLQSDLAALGAGLESNGRPVADLPAGLGQHAAQVNAGAAAELESPQAQHRSHIEELESWWRAERTPAAEMPATPEPAAAVHVEPERVAAVHTAPGPVAPVQAPPVPEPRPEIKAEPEPEAPAVATPEPEAAQPAHQEFDAAPAADATAVNGKPKPEENPPVILFKPKESGRTWRIPLVS